MIQAQFRIEQNPIGFVNVREVRIRTGRRWPIGVGGFRELMVFLLELFGIEPRPARLFEQREVIDHAAKLSPQKKCAAAFGLVTLKPPFCRSSLKSSSDPLTKSALLGSTTTRTLELSTMMSRLAGPSTRSILYCNPEHPPPITATRNAPFARPCFSSSESNLRDAFSVTLIKRSLPILKLTGGDSVVMTKRIWKPRSHEEETGLTRLCGIEPLTLLAES